MSVDQRLHRAAHGLRELSIDVPDLDPPRRDARRAIPAVLTSLLLVVGGAAVALDVTGRTAPPEAAQFVDEPDAGATSSGPPIASAERPLTAYEEVALIAGLGPPAANGPDSIGPSSEPVGLASRVN